MIDKAILSQNLNSEVDLTEFFNAFGYGPEDSVFFRLFKDPKAEKKDPTTGNPVPGKNIEAKPAWFKKTVQTLRDYNQKNYGVFWVVNGGGNSDSEVKTSGTPARAQFAECDPSDEDLKRVETGEIPMEDLLKDQLRRLSEFPLKPSIIIQTWKSLHCYWLLEGGDINRFRGIQKRLISLFHSDSTIQNESRVMRVPGFEHRKHDPVEVRLLRFEPDLRFTQDQIETALDLAGVPKEIPKKAAAVGTTAAPGEKIPKGQRYDYVQSKIGELVGTLKNRVSAEAVLEMVKQDALEHCKDAESIDDWEILHLPFIRKCQQKALEEPQENWSYNRKAWIEEHPGERFDPVEHPKQWEEAREAGKRAREADKRFDEGLAAHKAELAQKAKENGSGTVSKAESTPQDPEAPEQPASLTDLFGESALVDVIADYKNEIPEKKWVIEGICTEGECAIMSGSSKSGKSYLMTNLAITAARGWKWLNRFQCKKSRVLYLNGENSLDDARERFHACFDAMGVNPEDCEQIKMVCADGAMTPIDSIKGTLIAEIRKNQYGICILDPLYCFYAGSEVDEQDAKRFVSSIKEVCRETGTVVVCVHHHSKGAMMYSNASSRASGSGMLQRAFSTLLDVSEIANTEDLVPILDGQRAYELSGQPRQAPMFKINLIFDFPRWYEDQAGAIPDNAMNKGRTAKARQKNKNIQKSNQVRELLPQVMQETVEDNGKHDDYGDYVTLGDISAMFMQHGVEISERALSSKIDDGLAPGYRRDSRDGMKRLVRKVEWQEIAADRVPGTMFDDNPRDSEKQKSCKMAM